MAGDFGAAFFHFLNRDIMPIHSEYQHLIDAEQVKLKKFKISYFYLATGMEGTPDIFPEKVIEAPTKELAVYIYHLMFFASTSLEEIEKIRSGDGDNYSMDSFEEFLKENDDDYYWGITVEEVDNTQSLRDKSITLLQLLSNACDAEFDNHKLAVDIIEETLKNV